MKKVTNESLAVMREKFRESLLKDDRDPLEVFFSAFKPNKNGLAPFRDQILLAASREYSLKQILAFLAESYDVSACPKTLSRFIAGEANTPAAKRTTLAEMARLALERRPAKRQQTAAGIHSIRPAPAAPAAPAATVTTTATATATATATEESLQPEVSLREIDWKAPVRAAPETTERIPPGRTRAEHARVKAVLAQHLKPELRAPTTLEGLFEHDYHYMPAQEQDGSPK